MVEKRAKIQDQVNEPIFLGGEQGERRRPDPCRRASFLLYALFLGTRVWLTPISQRGLQRIKEIEFGINADEKKKYWRVIYGRTRRVSCPNAEQRKDCTVEGERVINFASFRSFLFFFLSKVGCCSDPPSVGRAKIVFKIGAAAGIRGKPLFYGEVHVCIFAVNVPRILSPASHCQKML